MMFKKFCLLITGLLLSASAVSAGDIFSDVRVEMKFSNVPSYAVSGVPNGKRGNEKWLVLDISYVVPDERGGWEDEVEIDVAALLPISSKYESGVVYLTGSTVLATVKLDGEVHRTRMLIQPHVFERYCASAGTALSDITVQVKIYSASDEYLGGVIESKNNMRNAAQAFREAESKGTKGLVLMRNYIFSRERTPWFFVMQGYFDPIAPEASKN